MFLPEFAVRRPVTVFMIFIGVVVLGIISFQQLNIDLMPDVSFPEIFVVTTYSGVGPSEMENMVTKPLEMALSAVKDVNNVHSYSFEGISALMLEFEWGIDMNLAAMDVREQIDMIRGRLPEGVENPVIIKFDPSMMPILFLGISSETRNPAELRYLADEIIESRLEKLEGVAAAQPYGGLEREIKVDLNRSRLEGLGISVDQIISAIGASNLDLAGGHLKFGRSDFLVRTTGQFTKPRQLENLTIANHQGRSIYLKDVAVVKDDFKEKTSETRIGGRPGVWMMVQKESRANIVKVADRAKDALEGIKKDLPQDVKIEVILDFSTFIKRSVRNVQRAALEGGGLAIIIVLLFLRNISSTLIISMALPISVVATFILLYFGNMTLNIATMGGLALGIGRVVDDAIVVLENIFRHRTLGERPKEASMIGASEVSTAVLAVTVTTIIVFVPILFVKGLAGMMFRPMAYTVALALAASYFVAMVLVPVLTSRFLKVEQMGNPDPQKLTFLRRLFNFSQKIFDSIDENYQSLVGWAITHKKWIVILVLGILIITLPLVKFIGTEFLPEVDQGYFQMLVKMPVGTDLESTNQVMAQIEEIIIKNVPELKIIAVSSGLSGEGMEALDAIFQGVTGPHAAAVWVELVPLSKRNRSIFEIVELLRSEVKDIPDADIKFSIEGMGHPTSLGAPAPIVAEIRGYDLETASRIAEEVSEIIAATPGTRDVRIDREEGLPELQIIIDREKASALGLNLAQIANTVQTNIKGTVASLYRDPKLGKEYNILVQLREIDRKNLLDLDRVFITSYSNRQIPLSNIAKVVKAEGQVRINRKNQERILNVLAQVSGRPAGSVAAEIESEIRRTINVPENFSVEITGTYKDQQESFKVLFLALLLAVVLVYMVLAAQFESFLDPFIIMFSVPLGIIGVIWGLFLTGHSINIVSLIGVIMMAGIVVSNGILLVDYTNILRRRGLELHAAVVTAGRTRLRPILMTSLTTMMALVPMAIGLGEGAEMRSPMAIAVISGLLASTVLTLIFVPTIYTIIEERIQRNK